MLARTLIFLIETAALLFTVVLLVRFMLQWTRAPLHNPLAHFVNAATNFAVLPARRMIPGLWGTDLPTLVVAWLVQLIELFLVLQLTGYDLPPDAGRAILGMLLLAAVRLFRLAVYVVIIVVIVQAVLSWVNPYSPIAPVLNALTRPFLRPVQRVVPLVGGVDLSPLVVIIVCQLILIVPVAYLSGAFQRLLV
jgi:YggT family protein